jgi:hypothetical protein
MVHAMPAGLEATLPLPLVPPCTMSGKLLGGAENAALMERSALIVTWQVRGASVSGASHPVHATAPPGDGVAAMATTMPESMSAAQVPLVVTPPALQVTAHATPPRLVASEPFAVLPLPVTVR